MEKKELNTLVKNHFKEIIKTHELKFDGGIGGISFSFPIDNYTEKEFGASIANYDNLQWCGGFNAVIVFKEVEDLVSEILVKNNLLGSIVLKKRQSTIGIAIQKRIGIELDFTYTDIKVTDEKTCNIFIERFDNFFHREALPFFEKWKNLNTLNEFLKGVIGDDIFNIFGSMGIFKKLVIMRLCNEPAYQDSMDSYFNQQAIMFHANPNDTENIRYYHATKELKELLDRTPPKYNL